MFQIPNHQPDMLGDISHSAEFRSSFLDRWVVFSPGHLTGINGDQWHQWPFGGRFFNDVSKVNSNGEENLNNYEVAYLQTNPIEKSWNSLLSAEKQLLSSSQWLFLDRPKNRPTIKHHGLLKRYRHLPRTTRLLVLLFPFSFFWHPDMLQYIEKNWVWLVWTTKPAAWAVARYQRNRWKQRHPHHLSDQKWWPPRGVGGFINCMKYVELYVEIYDDTSIYI